MQNNNYFNGFDNIMCKTEYFIGLDNIMCKIQIISLEKLMISAKMVGSLSVT